MVHCRLDELKGTNPKYANQTATYHAAYAKAKFGNDVEIAFEIIERVVSAECIDRVIDLFLGRPEPIFIYPYLPFDDEDGIGGRTDLRKQPSNALPAAYAAYLASNLGGTVNDQIIQSARASRTKLTTWLRFLCQPAFDGPVNHEKPYILVDDVITTGGTLATLRSYIISNGGTVAGTTVLAHKDGVHQKFAIADQTHDVLLSRYGVGLSTYWTGTFGHDTGTLTEAEAQFLALYEWDPGNELLQRLRERINQAAAKGE